MNDDEMKLDSDRDYLGKHVVYWHLGAVLGNTLVLIANPGVKGINVVQVFIDEIGLDMCRLNNVVGIANEG
jgi:hypothetical protein